FKAGPSAIPRTGSFRQVRLRFGRRVHGNHRKRKTQRGNFETSTKRPVSGGKPDRHRICGKQKLVEGCSGGKSKGIRKRVFGIPEPEAPRCFGHLEIRKTDR